MRRCLPGKWHPGLVNSARSTNTCQQERSRGDENRAIWGCSITHTWQRARRRIYMASYSRGRSSRQSEWVTLATVTTSYQREKWEMHVCLAKRIPLEHSSITSPQSPARCVKLRLPLWLNFVVTRYISGVNAERAFDRDCVPKRFVVLATVTAAWSTPRTARDDDYVAIYAIDKVGRLIIEWRVTRSDQCTRASRDIRKLEFICFAFFRLVSRRMRMYSLNTRIGIDF